MRNRFKLSTYLRLAYQYQFGKITFEIQPIIPKKVTPIKGFYGTFKSFLYNRKQQILAKNKGEQYLLGRTIEQIYNERV